MKKTRLFALLLILSMLVSAFAGAAAEELITVSADTGITAEETARGYISSVLYGTALQKDEKPMPRGAAARDNLSAKEKKLYDMILDEAKKVAAGQRTDTDFEFSMGEFSGTASVTPEEIGYPGLKRSDANYKEALKKAQKLLISDFDHEKVVKAVMMDNPYTLYWADGWSYGSLAACRYDPASDLVSAFVTDPSRAFLAGYTVAPQYADPQDKFLVKSGIGSAVAKAAENARAIVAENAGKGDVEKLTAYKDRICEMASYNHDAAMSDADTLGTNDPWQLIWALDGDESTKVVCEGYSKAFQYLCDLSAFSSSLVRSILVSGYMNGSGHMWNVVRLADGRNYLADVTNSDAGTSGQNGGLFLAKYAEKQEEGDLYLLVYAAPNSRIFYQYDSRTLGVYSGADLEMAQDTGDGPDGPDEVTLGDVNGDQAVDGRDVVHLMKHLAGDTDPETGKPIEINEKNADVDGSGNVDEKDLIRLVQYLGGENVPLVRRR